MRRIGTKLQSRRGASVAFALLLMLVAAMVSVTILSSAVTAAKLVRDDRERQQDYLALSSAARLLKKTITNARVTITEVKEDGVRVSLDAACTEPSLEQALAQNAKLAYDHPEIGFGSRFDPRYTITVNPDGGLRAAKLMFDMVRKDEALDYSIRGWIELSGEHPAADDPRIYLTAQANNGDPDKSSTTRIEKDLEGNDITINVETYTSDLNWTVTLTTDPPTWAKEG